MRKIPLQKSGVRIASLIQIELPICNACQNDDKRYRVIKSVTHKTTISSETGPKTRNFPRFEGV